MSEKLWRTISSGLPTVPTYLDILNDSFNQIYGRVYCLLMYMENRMKNILVSVQHLPPTTYNDVGFGILVPKFLEYFHIDDESNFLACACINRILVWRNLLSHTSGYVGQGSYHHPTLRPSTQNRIDKYMLRGDLWADRLVNEFTLMKVMRDIVMLDRDILPAILKECSDSGHVPLLDEESLSEVFPFWEDILGWQGLDIEIKRVKSQSLSS